jgi:hypothetical protein
LLRPVVACERHLEFGSETNIERKMIAHSFLLLRMSPYYRTTTRLPAGSLGEGLP